MATIMNISKDGSGITVGGGSASNDLIKLTKPVTVSKDLKIDSANILDRNGNIILSNKTGQTSTITTVDKLAELLDTNKRQTDPANCFSKISVQITGANIMPYTGWWQIMGFIQNDFGASNQYPDKFRLIAMHNDYGLFFGTLTQKANSSGYTNCSTKWWPAGGPSAITCGTSSTPTGVSGSIYIQY